MPGAVRPEKVAHAFEHACYSMHVQVKLLSSRPLGNASAIFTLKTTSNTKIMEELSADLACDLRHAPSYRPM